MTLIIACMLASLINAPWYSYGLIAFIWCVRNIVIYNR